MNYHNPIIYRDDPIEDFEDAMEFRLTYEGMLASTRNTVDKGYFTNKVKHKHEIRRHFHKQLKNLWEFHPVLKHKLNYYPERPFDPHEQKPGVALIEHSAIISDGFKWVPLIREKMA